MADTVLVVVKEPGEAASLRRIGTGLQDQQALVGGYLEAFRYPGGRSLSVFVNEEGLQEGLPANIRYPGGGPLLVGTIFVGRNNIKGDLTDIRDEDVAVLAEWLGPIEKPA